MSIIIYTYSNPYKINKEPYWAMIKNCFHLCVSQTLVNGLCDQYSDFYAGKLTTVNRFINNLYDNWESDATAICQRAYLDNLIDSVDYSCILGESINVDDIRISLKRNRGYVLDSLRIMFELNMPPDNIVESELTYDQKCLVALYKEIIASNNKYFILRNDLTKEEIDDAITVTMNEALRNENKRGELESITKDTIVVHGIHQFSPIVLRMIETLSKYKNVIILFNYLPDYKNVYQTWLNIYSWFESKINISEQIFYDNSQDFVGGRIADNMAAMIAGSTATIDYSNKIRVTEFDNQTEFAGYIAKRFEKAEQLRANDNYAHPALFYMEEQLYSANSKVNDVLKLYFPEQFGERNFLDYPIGHFFISITNMWDPDTQSMVINDLKDVIECLSCGIIHEDISGSLVSTLDKCKLYVSNEKTLKGIVKRLKKLKSRIDSIDSTEEELTRIEYFDVSENELDGLIEALKDLNAIAEQFFVDFNEKQNDFRKFYKKISDVLVTQVLDKGDLDEDFRDIVLRVLNRLNDVKDIEANASFDCLRETMQIYLQQLPKEGKGANWIVRNFEQIDGDVLRKNVNNNKKIYHFACLSDDDMSITHKDEFPWPLNINFFEVAQAPVDWKYQVFVTSRMEYKNFRRYALVYGLAFSRSEIELSYIKNENDKAGELYYLLRILNAQVEPYEPAEPNSIRKNTGYIDIQRPVYNQFSQYDLMKHRLCSYRFLMESVVESKTIYKDEFLLRQYLAIILEHRARKNFSGKNHIKNMVHNYLVEQMDALSSDFPFISQTDTLDVINLAEDYLEKHAVIHGKFATVKENEMDYMTKREIFLTVPAGKKADDESKEIFKNATQAEVDSILNEDSLSQDRYMRMRNNLCEKCADKDICLEIFKSKRSR